MTASEPRLQVLVVAFACCPPEAPQFSGGEDLLGWNLIQQVGRFHHAIVLTHAVDREQIERAWRKQGNGHVEFVYVGLPGWLAPLRRMPGGLQVFCYLWQLQAYRVARRLVREQRIDLAHHLTYANDWMASFIGAFLPVPFLRGPGGGAHRVPWGMLSTYSWRGRLSEQMRTILQRAFRLDPVFRLGQARAARLLVCNREALDALPPTWRQKAELFPVNGISEDDLQALAPLPDRDAGPLRILSAGKLMRLKGFPLALAAFRRVHEQRPGTELEIIGDGPDRSPLERMIKAWRLEDCVRLTPWQPRPALLERLRRCDVFLFTSLRDGGGAVVIEALAAGKPVVCLDLAGPGLHVTDACGVRVPAREPAQAIDELAAALRRLHDDAALRQALGRAGRTRTVTDYRWHRLGERLSEIYQQIEGQRSSLPVHDPLLVPSGVLHAQV